MTTSHGDLPSVYKIVYLSDFYNYSEFNIFILILNNSVLFNIFPATVAVNPGQLKPVKIAILVQNEATYYWDIKITQFACNQVRHFKGKQFTFLL